MSDTAEINENKDETAEGVNTEKYLIFSILGKLYSLPSRMIGEIALYDKVYPLPLMPSYVLGVVNRYSVPYALFDIGLLFHKTQSQRSKVLIFKDEIDHIAFLIDDVIGIQDLLPENLFHLERGADSGDLTDAVCASFNWEEKDVLVLDVHRIIGRVSGEMA
jgi:chemotaxis signal transduction protein